MKMRVGATHFLMKTLPKVAAEMALCVLTYNLTRVLNMSVCPRYSRRGGAQWRAQTVINRRPGLGFGPRGIFDTFLHVAKAAKGRADIAVGGPKRRSPRAMLLLARQLTIGAGSRLFAEGQSHVA